MELIPIISDLHSELKSLLPLSPEQGKRLEDKIRLEFNYNSNHIEGNTLTYLETELLLFNDDFLTTANHTFREFEEMKASDVTYHLVKSLAATPDAQLTEKFIKEVNEKLLVRPYWKEAITLDKQKVQRQISIGEYKKEPNSVLLENGEIFEYASPFETPALMGDLMDWVRNEEEKKEAHPVEIAAELHYRFVRIHPFDDGNGRISRLLMNYVLMKNDFPPVIIKSSDKKGYLKALRRADMGDLEPFKKYIGQQLIWSLELGLKAARNESLEEDEDWRKHLSLVKRNLASKDAIKMVKGTSVVRDIIKDVFYEVYKKTIDNLSDFDELFLYRNAVVTNPKTGASIELKGYDVPLPAIEKQFYNNVHLILKFEEFTKDHDNPFTVQILFEVQFLKHKFEIFCNGKLIFKKLYHQVFTDKDIYDFTNIIGKLLTTEIEQKTNTAM